MSDDQRHYLSFLLRLWQEPPILPREQVHPHVDSDSGIGGVTSGPPDPVLENRPNGDERVWRASLENPQTGELMGFGDVSQLFAFLEQKIAEPRPTTRGDHSPRGRRWVRCVQFVHGYHKKEEEKMTLEHEPVLRPDMPRVLGPYSQVVRAGEFLFVSGQAGLDPATGNPAGETFEQQARQAFANLSTVLMAADSSLADVVKTTVFCADPTAFATLNQLYGEYFPQSPPARSVPIVQLPRGLLVSIECIAVRGDKTRDT